MKSFRDHLNEKEQLNEEPITLAAISGAVGTVLGFGAVGAIAAVGAALIFKGFGYSFDTFKKSIAKLTGKSEEKAGEIASELKTEVKNDELYKVQKRQLDSNLVKYETAYPELFEAIENKKEQEVIDLMKKVDRKIRIEETFKRAFIAKASEAFEEPPLHYGPTGNSTYMFIKAVYGIQEAKEAAAAVHTAIKKYASKLVSKEEEQKEE